MINTNITLNKLTQLKKLIYNIEDIRNAYVVFGKVMEELENYLKDEEYQEEYEDTGEKNDFEEAYEKLEELFKFIITSKENKLNSILK